MNSSLTTIRNRGMRPRALSAPSKPTTSKHRRRAARIWNTRVDPPYDWFRDLCRSALAIAKRQGAATNWEAFAGQLENAFRSSGKKEQ
jgi:hypothetical protein